MSDSRTLNPANDFLELQNIEKSLKTGSFRNLLYSLKNMGNRFCRIYKMLRENATLHEVIEFIMTEVRLCIRLVKNVCCIQE